MVSGNVGRTQRVKIFYDIIATQEYHDESGGITSTQGDVQEYHDESGGITSTQGDVQYTRASIQITMVLSTMFLHINPGTPTVYL